MSPFFTVRLEDGEVYEIATRCPHRDGWLDHGRFDARAGVITCPLHFSTFDVRTGRRLRGPACTDIQVRRIRR